MTASRGVIARDPSASLSHCAALCRFVAPPARGEERNPRIVLRGAIGTSLAGEGRHARLFRFLRLLRKGH